jgi:hypothetical protein
LALEASPKERVLGTDVGSVTLAVALNEPLAGASVDADLQFSAFDRRGQGPRQPRRRSMERAPRPAGRGRSERPAAGEARQADAARHGHRRSVGPRHAAPHYGAVAVPLVSRQDMAVTSRAAVGKKGPKVLLDVAGQTYGPVDANKSSGKATVPGVMIPPGTTTAKITTLVGTESNRSRD